MRDEYDQDISLWFYEFFKELIKCFILNEYITIYIHTLMFLMKICYNLFLTRPVVSHYFNSIGHPSFQLL